MRTGPAAGGLDAARTLRVLLVEDSTADAELTVELLTEVMPDIEVTLARRLEEALAAATAAPFDVTLADLQLPDASGLEALRALRRPGVQPGAVVVLTGLRQDEQAERALGEGAQDYLVKQDLSADVLARAVRYAVSRDRAEQEASRSRQWAQSVLDSIEAPTCALDVSGTIVATNVAWQRFAEQNGGDPVRSGPGVDYLAVCEAAGDAGARQLAADLRALLRDGTGRVELEYPCHGPDSRRWFTLRATPVAGGGAAVVTHLDVTALKQAQEDLGHAARHDPLTGLANRRLLVEDLDRRLGDTAAGRAVAVLFLDLDRFKLVNDTLGHTAGDGVLVRVAAELGAAVRTGDLVARHGGDEFVVVADVADETEAVGLADRLQAAASLRLRLDGTEVDVAASSGLIVSRPGLGDTADEVLQAVDAAMHEAKDSGRGRVQVYSDDLRQRAKARAVLYRELTVAVEQDQFVLHYQPIVVPEVGGMHAVEALVRWQHPQRGLLAPAEFLDVAESTGLIVPIGRRVIEAACAQGRRLHDDGLQLSVSVNLSAKQLREPETASVIEAALARHGFPAHSLIVEVTETTMLDDTDAALASMHAIKALGVQLAVDDFGTGYSSLSYIRRYPVDGLKVDRSFVRDLVHSSDDRAIVGSLVRLARELDLWVVAEGVETPEQLAALRDMGCELVQGFLYARPLPAEDLHEAVHLLAARVPPTVPSPRPALDAEPEPATADPVVRRRIVGMTAEGASLHTIAAALNAEGCRTVQGLRWHPRSVARALSQGELVG